MISVQQIEDLESRVLRVVDLIEQLRGENRILRTALDASEHHTQELEGMLEELRGGQQEVEQIIVRTLQKIDGLENTWAELGEESTPDVDQTKDTSNSKAEEPKASSEMSAPPASAAAPPVPPGPGPASSTTSGVS